jgi:hypothetical protein
MRAKRVSFNRMRSVPVKVEGGLNENVSSIELRGGELIACLNYQFFEGSSGGYVSIEGFERYDGKTSPSSISASESDDTDREAARSAIGEVPGEDAVLAVKVFEGNVYAFRNKVGGATAGMYKATTSGWVEVDTSANPLSPNGDYNFIEYNFFGSSSTVSMYWTDGVNKARAFDGTTVTVIDNAGMNPNDKPINITAHNERLWLVYPGGSLQYSTVADPNDWTTSAGEFGLGREITDLIVGVGGTLIIFCDKSIKILKGSGTSDWVLETFSDISGAYKKTAFRMFGTVYHMDGRGVTSLTAVQEFGDFGSNGISQKVYKTLQENKNNITTATVSRIKNQYRLYFNSGLGVYFSFYNKRLRGVTLINLGIPVLTVSEGVNSDGDEVIFFTSSSGYVYQMDTGTSFDGAEIPTKLSTSFYHYGSPRLWKKFRSIEFEVASLDPVDVLIRTLFDYSASHLPVPGSVTKALTGAGSLWGTGVWGVMRWSTGESTNRFIHYIKGLGSNMSISFITSSKYSRPHTLQNFTTDFELTKRQL